MITILSLIITSFSSFACLIEGPERLYSFNGVRAEANYLKCSTLQKDKFNTVLADAQGTLNSKHYKRISGDSSIKLLKPIHIVSLEQFIKSQVNLPSNIKLDIKTSQIAPDFTSLRENERLDIECDSCHLEGTSNIKLTKTIGNRHKVLWVSARTLFKTKVLVSTTNLPYSFDSIKDGHFQLTEKYISSPTQVFTDEKALRYHKLTKNISKGHILKYSDIIKKELVRYGKPVNVIISNAGLKMTTKAKPLENGFLGDDIRLKNMSTNKIFVGKVTNTNEVKVKL